MKNKNIMSSILLIAFLALLVLFTYFLYRQNNDNLNKILAVKEEILQIKHTQRTLQKTSPKLRAMADKIFDYMLKQDNVLFFIDSFEKDLQDISSSAKLVSTRIDKDAKGSPGVLVVNISATDEMSNIDKLISNIERLEYLSYLDSLSVEKLPGKDSKWQMRAVLKVFIH